MQPSDDRIRAFLADPDAASVASPRRVGRMGFADSIQQAMSDMFPDARILRFDDPVPDENPFSGRLQFPEGKTIVLVTSPDYVPFLLASSDAFALPGVSLYCIQELCHQVCVCMRGLRGLGTTCTRARDQ